MSKRNKVNIREVWKGMFPEDAQKFLDIGCSHGGQTKHLVEQGKEVVGVEVSQEQAVKAREKLTKVFTCDAQNLDIPYDKEYFDCLIYGGVIGAFRESVNALKLHAQYLKPGGHLVAHMLLMVVQIFTKIFHTILDNI